MDTCIKEVKCMNTQFLEIHSPFKLFFYYKSSKVIQTGMLKKYKTFVYLVVVSIGLNFGY